MSAGALLGLATATFCSNWLIRHHELAGTHIIEFTKQREALFNQLEDACEDLDEVCDRADELIDELLGVAGNFLSVEELDQLNANAILAGLHECKRRLVREYREVAG